MSTTGIYTVRDITRAALRKIGVVGEGEPMTAEQAETAMGSLDRMLKAWQNRGFKLFRMTRISVPVPAGVSVALPERVIRIHSMRFRRAGIDTPMQEMTAEEYDVLPTKTSAGLPTTWYYDRQAEAGTVYLWPILAAPAGETLEMTVEREIEDIRDLNAALPMPGEWWDAVVYSLAARLADDFTIAAPNVVARAEIELDAALAGDRETSVFFT